MIEVNSIYNEDCLDTMARMEDNFIDLTITSPPYDNLRDYKGYEYDFPRTATELYRVTKNGGVVVWIVNDATIKGNESGSSFKQALYFQEIGFRIHDTMIWLKPSTPFPGNNRYGQVFEFMYILAKGKLNIFNPINDRKNIYGGYNSGLKKTFRDRDGSSIRRNKAYTIPEYGPRHNVWKIGVTEKKETNHPATFPEELVKGHILTWSNEGDLIYDCFLGSGSTAKVAKQLNRNYLGSEVSQEYYIAACKRINRTRGLVCIER